MTTTQTTLKFSRLDYLHDKCTHSEYYAQFVTESMKRSVKMYFSDYDLPQYLSQDENLNNIPLAKWDTFCSFLSVPKSLLVEAGDYPTLAGKVCIAKEAARQIAKAI